MKTRQVRAALIAAVCLVFVCAPSDAAINVIVTSNSNPSQLGEYVTFTATVTGVAPSGTVSFVVNGGAPSSAIALVPQNGNVSIAAFVASALSLGNSSVVAQYTGNLGSQSSSPFLQSVINTRSSTTTTTLAASPDPSTQGQSVTFTATMSGVGAPPAGTVNFYSRDGLGLLTLMGSSAASPAGNLSTASFSSSSLPLGTTAVFANFMANAPLRMSTGNRSVTVNPAGPAATSSLLIISPAGGTVGDTLTFTANVTSGGGTPTGTVLFTIGGSPSGPFSLTNGSVGVPVTFLTPGNFSASFVYTPSGNFLTSSSNTGFFTIQRAATTTSLGSSQNPATQGALVIFTASVTSAYAGTPGGTMNFTADGSPICTSVSMSSGSAQCSTSALVAGSRLIQADYSGDSLYAASSGSLSETINPAASVTVTSSANPSEFRQFVTFTAQVVGVSPSGSVTFTVDGGAPTPAITLTAVNGNLSTATWVASTLAFGTRSVVAQYVGNLGSYSSPAFSQSVVNTRSLGTTTSLVASPNPATLGQSVTFTATLLGSGSPRGTVTFYSRDPSGLLTAMGSFANVSTASLSTSSLPFGPSTWFANFVSNSPYLVSTGNLSVTVLAPEINVKGNSTSIVDGDNTPALADDTDFGNATVGSPVVKTYTIENLASGALLLTGTPRIVVGGANAADFSVSLMPTSPVNAFSNTTFQVSFTPGGVGTRTATLSIDNNDSNENPYDFSIQGTGVSACPTITLAPLSNGIVNTSYSGAATASGGTGPYAYALTSGALPTGLTLDSSTGALSVTPSATGTFNFQITATDTAAPGTCTGSRNYTIVIGSAVAAGDLVIREFRLRGPASSPAGDTDEYVVIHNRTASSITVATTDGSSGYAVARSDGNLVFTIPNGTVIPARGHFLGVNSVGFSLGATPDASWTTDIADGLGLGLFRTATPANFTAPNALDAVGVGSSTAPYLEGTALASLPTPGEFAWVRKAVIDAVQDTGANSADFTLVATDGASHDGVQSVLGAPAPTSGVTRDVYSGVVVSLIEPNLGVNLNPNRLRVLAGGDRLEFRRRITNNTGSALTALRLRFNELTTLNSPGYSPGTTQADLRPGNSNTVAITLTSIGANSVTGLLLATPPTQTLRGGLNSVLTIPGGLAPGASIDINIALYVGRAGSYRFFATIEGQ